MGIAEHFTAFHSLHCCLLDDDGGDNAMDQLNSIGVLLVQMKCREKSMCKCSMLKSKKKCATSNEKERARARFVEAENHAVTAATFTASAIGNGKTAL